jgi:hypothetical protein
MAALRGVDGPWIVGRMAPHTANAGKIFFAAGTPDPGDIRGERLDLAGSVMRELGEEMGLVAADVMAEPGYAIVFAGPRIACMRELRTHAPAAEIVSRVRTFIAAETMPELDDAMAIASVADLDPQRMPDFALAYLMSRLGEACASGSGGSNER